MAQALKIRYTPGDTEPSSATNSPRVILNWRKARDEYWERQAARQLREEQYAEFRQQNPNTIAGYQKQEADAAARHEWQARIDAEEEKASAVEQRQQQERERQQARRRDECYILYWQAETPKDRGVWLYEYSKAVNILRELDAGFRTQLQVDTAMKSISDINNCPATFLPTFKQIRGLTTPALPPPTPEQRLAKARQTLLGI